MNKENVKRQPRGHNTSHNQKNMLVEFARKNPTVIAGKQTQNLTQKNIQEAWEGVTRILNSMPGASKTWKQWRKTWQDLKSRTKNKEANNRRERYRTGGGPAEEEPLDDVEEAVRDIIKPVSIVGHDNPESEVTFSFNNAEEDSIFIDMDNISEEPPSQPTEALKRTAEHVQVEETCVYTNPPVPKQGPPKKKCKKIDALVNSTEAVNAFKTALDRKLELKEQFYEKKITLLKEQNDIRREQVEALRSIATALQDTSVQMN